MKNICYFLCFSLMLLVTSCEYDEHLSSDNQNGETITIVAHMPHDGGRTKVSFDDNEEDRVLYVDWKDSGEEITVLASSRNETYVQTPSLDDAKNVFTGQRPLGFTPSYAIYPSNGNASKTSVPYDLSEQTGLLNESKTYMYASVGSLIQSGTELNFRHLTAIIKPDFNLAEGEKIQSVIVTLPENVYSKGTVNLEDQTYAADGDNKRTINIVADNEEQIYVYVPAFEVSESVNIIFEIYTTRGLYTATKTVAKNIEPGVLYEADIEMTLCSDYVWSKGIESEIPDGEGTEQAPYQIVTAKHLQWLLDQVNIENNASNSKYYKLMHDIVINSSLEHPWTPIGNASDEHRFYGTFVGNSNCAITGTLVSQYYGGEEIFSYHADVDFGLFGFLGDNSNIKDLTLNLYVLGGNSKKDVTKNADKHSNTGILAGRIFGGTVSNCTVKGYVQGGIGINAKNISHTGGVVGYNNKGTITGCTNMSTVVGGKGSNSSFTGGITGRSGYQGDYEGEIKECVNRGEIIGGSRGNGGGDQLVSTGGIIGSFDKGSIHTSSNYGTISGDNNNYFAGVVGRVRGSVASVYDCNTDYAGVYKIDGEVKIIGNIGVIMGSGDYAYTVDVKTCAGVH